MKNIFTLLALCFCSIVYSQELPTKPAFGAAFPINTKFTIKMYPVDSIKYKFSVVAFEEYNEVIDTWGNDTLFEDKALDSTISFYFGFGTHGKTEDEKKQNMQVVLLMKNYTENAFNYKSDIKRKPKKKKFEKTSNIGTFSGAKGVETWPYMIYMIGLHDFTKMQFDKTSILSEE